MKKLLFVTLMAALLLGCSKNEQKPKTNYINTPMLPAKTLEWGMKKKKAVAELAKNMYFVMDNSKPHIYIFKNNITDEAWTLNFDENDNLEEMYYWYLGNHSLALEKQIYIKGVFNINNSDWFRGHQSNNTRALFYLFNTGGKVYINGVTHITYLMILFKPI